MILPLEIPNQLREGYANTELKLKVALLKNRENNLLRKHIPVAEDVVAVVLALAVGVAAIILNEVG